MYDLISTGIHCSGWSKPQPEIVWIWQCWSLISSCSMKRDIFRQTNDYQSTGTSCLELRFAKLKHNEGFLPSLHTCKAFQKWNTTTADPHSSPTNSQEHDSWTPRQTKINTHHGSTAVNPHSIGGLPTQFVTSSVISLDTDIVPKYVDSGECWLILNMHQGRLGWTWRWCKYSTNFPSIPTHTKNHSFCHK